MAMYDDVTPIVKPPPLVAPALRQAIPVAHPTTTTGAAVAPPGPVAPPPKAAPAPVKAAPNWLALIQASPQWKAWIASKNATLANAATDRARAIRQAILQWGGIPPGFKDQFGDITQADIDAAKGNVYSTQNQISRAHDMALNQGRRALEARGVLQSG